MKLEDIKKLPARIFKFLQELAKHAPKETKW